MRTRREISLRAAWIRGIGRDRALSSPSASACLIRNVASTRGQVQVVGRPGRPLEEDDGSPSFLLEFLCGQAVERGRSHPGLLRADRVGRVVEEDRLERPVAAAERQHGQFRVERPRGTHGIATRADPVNRSIPEQEPAVPAHRRLLAHPEEERAGSQPVEGRDAGLDDLVLDLTRERLLPVIAVNRHGGRGVMRVRRIDQNVIKRNSGLPLQPPGGAIEDVALDHQHVAGDEGGLLAGRTFDDDGRGSQLAFLPVGLARADPAADHQGIVGLENRLGRAGLELARRERHRQDGPGNRRAEEEQSHVLTPCSSISGVTRSRAKCNILSEAKSRGRVSGSSR